MMCDDMIFMMNMLEIFFNDGYHGDSAKEKEEEVEREEEK